MTPTTLAVLLGVSGLLFGSFLGLVSLRFPRGEGFVGGRSQCAGCGLPLAPWRMIPVISYIVSGGACSACGARIPRRYPLIELGAAGAGIWAALAQPDALSAILTCVLGWQLLLLAVVDAEHFWLPDQLTLPLLVTGLLNAALPAGPTLPDAVVGAVSGFAFLWLLAAAYRRVRGREGLGGGDPFLLAAGGAWVGWVGLPSVLLWASAAGLSLTVARMLTGNAVSGGDRIPFGPCLAAGIWLTSLLGPLGL